jgi:hypothetical protein
MICILSVNMAISNAVPPFSSFALTSAPLANNALTTSVCPVIDAAIKAVPPFSSFALTSAP